MITGDVILGEEGGQYVTFVSCSRCGKAVSSGIPMSEPGQLFIVRAWVECPECVEKNEPANARIRELEIELAVKESTIADLRDYNERVVTIAAEDVNKVRAELEAQLAEARQEVKAAKAAMYGEHELREEENAVHFGEMEELERQLESAESMSENRRRLLEISDARVTRLSERAAELEARLKEVIEIKDEIVADREREYQRGNAAEARAEAAEKKTEKAVELLDKSRANAGNLLVRMEAAEADAGRLRAALEAIHERARLGGGEAGLAGEQYALLDIFTMAQAALAAPDASREVGE